jgi:hypothetical protein
MLVALLPNQVSEYWPLFKGHIEDSMPPTGDWIPYDMNLVLFHLIAGDANLWILKDKEHNVDGLVLTTIYNDISGVRTLMLNNVVVVNKKAKVNWQIEFDTLKKYAYSKGCTKIGSFIMNQKLLDILKEHDVETRFTFAHINI